MDALQDCVRSISIIGLRSYFPGLLVFNVTSIVFWCKRLISTGSQTIKAELYSVPVDGLRTVYSCTPCYSQSLGVVNFMGHRDIPRHKDGVLHTLFRARASSEIS